MGRLKMLKGLIVRLFEVPFVTLCALLTVNVPFTCQEGVLQCLLVNGCVW